jgi:hypothetical protein
VNLNEGDFVILPECIHPEELYEIVHHVEGEQLALIRKEGVTNPKDYFLARVEWVRKVERCR